MRQRVKEVHRLVLEHYEDMVMALIQDVQDPDSRTKPHSLRVLLEAIDAVGKGTSVYGDVTVNSYVQDLSQHVHLSEEEQERYRELLTRHGLASELGTVRK